MKIEFDENFPDFLKLSDAAPRDTRFILRVDMSSKVLDVIAGLVDQAHEKDQLFVIVYETDGDHTGIDDKRILKIKAKSKVIVVD